MIKLEDVVVEYTNSWNKNVFYNYYKVITKEDVEELKNWLKGSVVKFNGNNGKVFFHTDTEFPRYKFTEYSRNNNKVRRVKKAISADVIVLDVDRYVKILESIESFMQKKYYITGKKSNDGLYDLYQETTGSSCTIEGYVLNKYYNEHINTLEILIELYNNNNQLKSVKIQDLNEVITKNSNPITVEMSEQIDRLLSSHDNETVKLGMEFLTNCDFEASLFHIILLCGKHGGKMKSNPYWNSTSFKTFRDVLLTKNVNVEYLRGNNSIKSVETFLALKGNKYLYEDDVEYIKNCIKQELDEQYTFDTCGYIIKNYQIELNIDQSKIIKLDQEGENKEEVDVTDTSDTQTEDFILTE